METKEQTRAEIIMDLFEEYDHDDFTNNYLIGSFVCQTDNACDEYRYLNVFTTNVRVLYIYRMRFSVAPGTPDWEKPRTPIYDAAYSDQLDEYIAALRTATEKQRRVVKEKRAKDESLQVFEETRF